MTIAATPVSLDSRDSSVIRSTTESMKVSNESISGPLGELVMSAFSTGGSVPPNSAYSSSQARLITSPDTIIVRPAYSSIGSGIFAFEPSSSTASVTGKPGMSASYTGLISSASAQSSKVGASTEEECPGWTVTLPISGMRMIIMHWS